MEKKEKLKIEKKNFSSDHNSSWSCRSSSLLIRQSFSIKFPRISCTHTLASIPLSIRDSPSLPHSTIIEFSFRNDINHNFSSRRGNKKFCEFPEASHSTQFHPMLHTVLDLWLVGAMEWNSITWSDLSLKLEQRCGKSLKRSITNRITFLLSFTVPSLSCRVGFGAQQTLSSNFQTHCIAPPTHSTCHDGFLRVEAYCRCSKSWSWRECEAFGRLRANVLHIWIFQSKHDLLANFRIFSSSFLIHFDGNLLALKVLHIKRERKFP